jgi:sugar lactone lactonase YvrE
MFYKFNGLISSINLCKSGKLLITSQNQIFTFDPNLFASEVLHQFAFDGEPYNRINDCKVLPSGDLIYSVFSDLKPRPMHGSIGIFSFKKGDRGLINRGFITPNGMVANPVDDLFWISDTGQSKIYQYYYSTIISPKFNGEIKPKKVIEVSKECGRPDGASLDLEGNYWVALLGRGMVGCWSSQGNLLSLNTLEAENPTMAIFCGQSLELGLVTKKLAAEDGEELYGFEYFSPSVCGQPAFYFEDTK